MKAFLKKTFPGIIGVINRIYNYVYHLPFYNRSREQVFSSIYKKNHWADKESASGPGSSFDKTVSIRERIPVLLSKYEIKSMLDVPCGDFNWMREVDINNIRYRGLDIVQEIVKKNAQSFSNEQRSFGYADITVSSLPKFDLIFCRDCLVHLSYDDIRKAIVNMKKSGCTYLLITTFVSHTNHNIITGDWRPINLQARPFSWPPPLEVIHEDESGDNADKSMALWRLEDIKT